MKNRDPKDKTAKKVSFLRTALLWLLLAALMTAMLVPLISIIWGSHTRFRTVDECRLLADAIIKQCDVDDKRIRRSNQFLETYLIALNTMSGWADVYGGTDEAELSVIRDDDEFSPIGTAILKGDEYKVLSGDLPRDEFDSVLETNGLSLSDISALSSGSESKSHASSVMEKDGFLYVSSALKRAGAVVMSKMPPQPEIGADRSAELDLIKLSGSFLSKSGIATALVRMSDDTVLQTSRRLPFEAGEKLVEVPDETGSITIGGRRYIGGAADNGAYRVYALVGERSIFSRISVSPLINALIFAAVFLLTGLYAWFLRRDILDGRIERSSGSRKDEAPGSVLIRHVRLVFWLILGAGTAVIILFCAVAAVDGTRVWGQGVLNDIERYFEANDHNLEALTSSRKTFKISALDKICALIDESPERLTSGALSDLSLAVDRNIFVLDKDGTVVAASESEYDFSGLADPDSPIYPLSSVLDGKADHLSVAVSSDREMISRLCWAVRRAHGGMVVTVDDLSQAISFSEYYADYTLPRGLVLLVTDLTTGEILSGSDSTYVGTSAGSAGLTEDVLQDGFAGDIRLGGRRFFAQTNVHGDRADLIAADLSYLFRVYAPVILLTLAVGFAALFVMCALAYELQNKTWTDLSFSEDEGSVSGSSSKEAAAPEGSIGVQGEASDAEVDSSSFYREDQDGTLRAERDAVSRWMSVNIPFRSRTADEKFRTIIHYLSAAVLVLLFISTHKKDGFFTGDSAFSFLFGRTWVFGMNIYAITYALIIVFTITTVGIGLRRLILMAGSNLGNRGETVTRLVSSFIAYASVAFAIGYGLLYIGVNATTILASAGIAGLGLSIGAKDLISDVLAGMSIVFEGEFRTGDIVEINGFRGTVEEIGVRTTKIMSMQNVKVFRNSEISGVINMTQRHSIAQVRIAVTKVKPLESVEAIIKNELPAIKEKIPQAVSDIELCGIDEIAINSVTLLFHVRCREKDRVLVERALLREFDLLLEREELAPSGPAVPAGSAVRR